MAEMKAKTKFVVEVEDDYETFDNLENALARAEELKEGYEELDYSNYEVRVVKVITTESLIKTFKTKGA